MTVQYVSNLIKPEKNVLEESSGSLGAIPKLKAAYAPTYTISCITYMHATKTLFV
jgi:hypothetical protein